MNVKVQNFIPEQKKSLRGYVDVVINGVFVVKRIACLKNEKGAWISFPSRANNQSGKTVFEPLVELNDDALLKQLTQAVNQFVELQESSCQSSCDEPEGLPF